MAEDRSSPLIETPNFGQDEEAVSNTFDYYRSVPDPNLMIFVEKDAVPPFRFRLVDGICYNPRSTSDRR